MTMPAGEGAEAAMRPFQVTAKPAGARCNLDCAYCYYLEKAALYPGSTSRMSDQVLEAYIRDHIAAQARAGLPRVDFSWQGGEPTLLDISFFERVRKLQDKHRASGIEIGNLIQTNGTLLDEDWAAFLKRHDFLVGLSLDGPKELHDRFRGDRKERPTFDRVMAALDLLQRHEVAHNVLTVVSRANAKKPLEVYRFLKGAGVTHMQFIPAIALAPRRPAAVPRKGPALAVWSVRARDYGDFLCAVFDDWTAGDVGRVSVQFFDVMLGAWMGRPSPLCWYAAECSQCLALEHNGDLYSCDHYVEPGHLLGNITEAPIEALANGAKQTEFGHAKSDLPQKCRKCFYRFACHGGCPKHRFVETEDGEAGLNYLCEAHLRFFAHAGEALTALAGGMRP
jgi:uncharacterized protein